MIIVKAASEQIVYSEIFRPKTTTRLQVVAEKCCMYSRGDNEFIEVGWERGQVWACSKFVGRNEDNVKINSIIVRKMFVLCK